jgi:4-amino-4-deoxy-L-arabinose transferase-like glycosyltransferase
VTQEASSTLPRRVVAVLAFVLLLPVALAVIAFPTAMYDTRELIAWGRHFPLVTPDHPPMMAWIGGTVDLLFGHSAFVVVLANQILMAIGLAYFHAVLRLVGPRSSAWLFTLLYGASFYLAFAPLSFALNADILQLTSWPAVVYYCLRAARTNQWAHWLGFGASSAAALLTKYNAAVLLAGIGVAMMAEPAFRRMWRHPRLYAAIALGLALVAPHVHAVLTHGQAVSYGLAHFTPAGAISKRLLDLGQLLLGHAIFLLPGAIIVLIGLKHGELALRSDNVANDERRFLVVMNIGMQAALLLLVLGTGLDYIFRFSAPYAMMIALGLAPLLRPNGDWRRWAERRVIAVLGGLYLAIGVIVATVYTIFASHSAMQEPTEAGARAILDDWDKQFPCGPAYFIGGRQKVYGVGIAAGPQITGLFYRDIAGAAWFDRAKLLAGGGIVMDGTAEYQSHLQNYLFGLPPTPERSVTVPLRRTFKSKNFTYVYHFIPPQDCGRADLRRPKTDRR